MSPKVPPIGQSGAVSLDGALAGEGGAALQGEAQLIASNAAEELDGAATPAMLESVQLGEGDGGGASQMNGTSMTPGTTTMLAREYVWGPGDWGVDELLVQYDAARRATWPILDSGGDVIALCDLGGANNSARVLTNIVYDAYGRVIGRSNPATPATGPPELRVGHKGLFFDRLDWGIVDPLTLAETPRLEPGATLLGYNRNRTLHVGWGRFLQRDPNATGLPVQAGLAFHGDGFDTTVQGFDLAAHYGDGANVYEYIGSDPLGGGDPTGLMEFSLGGQMATMAINSWDSASGTLETAQLGLQSGFSLLAMVEEYQWNTTLDADWASDWDLHDFDYYAGGITDLAYGVMYVSLEESHASEAGLMMAAGYHGNSLQSQRKNYGYTLSYVPKTGSQAGTRQVYKYGITSSEVNKSGAYQGLPKRVAQQMAKLKRKGLNPKASIKTFKNRQGASNWETGSIKSGKSKGLRLPGNKRIPR